MKIFLIDEGWYPKENHSYFLTNNKIESKELIGYIRYPRKAKLFTPKNNITANEWYTYNLTEIGDYLGIKINQKYFIKNMSSPAETFLIPSKLKPTFRNNHLQYAITWFLMSFAFFVLFLVYLKKKMTSYDKLKQIFHEAAFKFRHSWYFTLGYVNYDAKKLKRK